MHTSRVTCVASLSGVVLIVASSYLLPELLADFDVRGYSQTFLEVTGTVVVIASYVLVFVVVPAMEVRFMRHKAFADLEAAAKQRISDEVRNDNFRKPTLPTPELRAKIKHGDMDVVHRLLT